MPPEAQQPLNVAKSYNKLLCVAKKIHTFVPAGANIPPAA